MVNTVNQCGSAMVRRATDRLDHAAEQIAKASMSTQAEARPTDLIKAIAELPKADLETQAAVKLLHAEEKAIATLIDVKA